MGSLNIKYLSTEWYGVRALQYSTDKCHCYFVNGCFRAQCVSGVMGSVWTVLLFWSLDVILRLFDSITSGSHG